MFSCFLVIALAPAALIGLDSKNLLIYAPFDGTLDAAFALGETERLTEKEAYFDAGLKGKALLFRSKDFKIFYRTQGNVLSSTGTFIGEDKLLHEGRRATRILRT